ncbi:GGDEF domain-containing protein [Campylobacter porcelli]|uniref:Putative diguanylate cyclase n=1 Tax=Campylobacter porcelli TaxID=1660073 RepID=A0A1X9SUN3_9BACT|nr:diguanylate cyclase [Campylobacter sp. RM6137]ARQ99981.1 putative diguanylate cyclase [Campylobacter sp. RM6137]
MVKLDEDKAAIKETTTISNGAPAKPAAPRPSVPSTQDENVDLNKFSSSVLKQLLAENIQPTPDNFDIYFRKLLENKPANFQKKVLELLDFSKEDKLDRQALIEKDIKTGFAQIRSMMQLISLIYKNLGIMKGIAKKRLSEMNSNANPLEVQGSIKAFGLELEKLNILMDRHINAIRASYEEVDKIFKNVEDNSIYDSKFEVYNKKYLLKILYDEFDDVKRYKYNVSIMLIRVKDKVLNAIPSIKDKNGILRNIAKILLKTSRRSDIVAHYGDGCFAMVMKHTDLESAKKAAQRVAELLYQTTFFMGEDELDMDMEIAVGAINPDSSIEEILSALLDALPKSAKGVKLFESVEA